MSHEIELLIITAASLGFIHTIAGPDHYLPFIVLSKAKGWTKAKTLLITTICGLGHVGSSIVIGSFGVALGLGVKKLEGFESFRGNIASWFLMFLGLIYLVWAFYMFRKNKLHKHVHINEDGSYHEHSQNEHNHDSSKSKNATPWVLFTIFALSPCEPLIPILMYPAAKNSINGLIAVIFVFALVTISTMIGIVILGLKGFELIKFDKIEKYTHIIAGITIFLSGLMIVAFDW